jgi:diguanylate cyclase (GGDEF)-like protein/PAS domain S-box-containing protein
MADKLAPLGPDALDAALNALLAEYPGAFVAAISAGGGFVPMPASVPLTRQRELRGRSALDYVVPEDREVVISTWERARASGASSAQVRLKVSPDRPAVIHYLDARAHHGVYLGVIVGGDAAALASLPDTRPQARPPRVARARKNEVAVFLEVDEATTTILGWTAADMVGFRSLDFIHPDDQEAAIESWMQMLSEPGIVQPPVRLRHRRAEPSWAWFEVTNHNRLADPDGGYVLAEMIDISEEMAAQEALRAREQLLHRLTEALPTGVFQVLPDRRIAYTNDRLSSILGLDPAATLDAQLATVLNEDRPLLLAALDAALDDGADGDLEVRVQPGEESRARRCRVRLRTLTNERGDVTGAVVSVEDVTESAQLRAELERRATHDLLTRVMNRDAAMDALEASLAGQGARTAVIYVDIDRFKAVNDQLGHTAGDELLRVVADRLAGTVRAGDTLGRVGGDEFLVVCPGVVGAEPARRVADRIASAVNKPVTLAGVTREIQVSIGVAHAGRRVISADALVGRADAAMYASKRRGRGRPVAYSSALKRSAPIATRSLRRPEDVSARALS